MRPTAFSADTILALLRKQTIATLPEVIAALGPRASRRTAFRKLKDLDARTSYSHRGGYYTLDALADFDEHGLWSFAGVRFSRVGTLIATAESFVNHAEAGYFVDELDNLLAVGTQDPLRKLVGNGRLTRHKLAGQFLYCAADRVHQAHQLRARRICARTVARLLKKMGFSLRVNHKKRAGASHPNRDDQFHHIAELRERCAADNTPVISVDTKKKELVGAFRNPGAKWDRRPELVNDHDFRSDADGLAIPYGIYDTRANAGTVFVGQTADTPAYAVDCIEKWWRTEGCKHYPEAEALQILADGGGSNSCTARAWKFNLQHRLCNRHGLRVRVAHYPPATSKWNPIEHRMFCEVTKNWAGRPLDSYETILKYLRTTRTATGLRVRAHLVRKTYKTGVKVTDAQMQELRITPDSSLPKWNYTIEPM